MTVDPSSLLTISIGTIIALIGVVVAATATWTRLGMRLEVLAVAVHELKSWHLRATESARDDLDDAVEAWRQRWHVNSSRAQEIELRLTLLEDRAGIPQRQAANHTPIEAQPITGRHRRTAQSDPTPDPR